MRHFTVTAGLALAVSLSACASLIQPEESPLALALVTPLPELEARAARGENQAEYALSFLVLNGLRGVDRDPQRFQTLRQGAQTPTTLMITQYIPAVGGGAGRTHMIPVSQPGMREPLMRMLDMCGAALLTGYPRATDLCPEGVVETLGKTARQVAAASAARTPLP